MSKLLKYYTKRREQLNLPIDFNEEIQMIYSIFHLNFFYIFFGFYQ